MNRDPFTPSEEKFLRENFAKITAAEMALHLKCSKSKVKSFFSRNNLKMTAGQRKNLLVKINSGKTTFLPWQSKFLEDNYLTMPIKTMAEKIGKSGTGVNIRLKQLGLVIPREIIEKHKKESQFKPGTPGWNKGKKQTEYMSREKIAKTTKTRFKKGQLPHNTAPGNGTIRIRKDSGSGIPYKYIRVKKGEWELYSRFLWRKHRGEIPPGNVIRFKNGNTLDCHIENLECVTMAKNLQLNWHNYPQDLKRVIKLTHKIQKEL